MLLGSLILYSAAKRRMATSVELRSRTCVFGQVGDRQGECNPRTAPADHVATVREAPTGRLQGILGSAQPRPWLLAHLGSRPRQLCLILGVRQQGHDIGGGLRLQCRQPAEVALLVACKKHSKGRMHVASVRDCLSGKPGGARSSAGQPAVQSSWHARCPTACLREGAQQGG